MSTNAHIVACIEIKEWKQGPTTKHMMHIMITHSNSNVAAADGAAHFRQFYYDVSLRSSTLGTWSFARISLVRLADTNA